jgi:IMP dehydrogenase
MAAVTNTLRRCLTFDDVGLVPCFNAIKSRLDVSLGMVLGGIHYDSPFIPANMDSVICNELAAVCIKRGAPIVYHRFSPFETQVEFLKTFPNAFMSIGITVETNKFKELYAAGARNFTIDIAHGHSMPVVQIIRAIKSFDSKCVVMAGNVCTGDGFSDLAEAGADIVKVGVGPGAACTTRIMTGVGVPQFSAIVDCAAAKARLKSRGIECSLVADGGIKYPRDACLAIAAGADAVMMGSVFARTYESAAKKTERDGRVYGRYRGQASSEFMEEFFGNGRLRQPEGVAFDVEIKQSADDVFDYYEGGLRSSMTYLGAADLNSYVKNAVFFESTQSYVHESHARPAFCNKN